MSRVMLCGVLAGAFLTATGVATVRADDEKVKKPPADRERIQGRWKVVSLEVDGKMEKKDLGTVMTIDGDKLILPDLGDVKLTLRLAPDQNPKEFDVLDGEGNVVLRGIYKLDGDTLTACYPGGANLLKRPKEFSGAEGRGQVLFTAKRDGGKD